MKRYECSNGHKFNRKDAKESMSPGKGFNCPECLDGMLKKVDSKGEHYSPPNIRTTL